MRAPVCRVCGKAHWSGEPHVFEGANTAGEGVKASPPNLKAELSGETKEVSAEALRKRRWREKNRDKYNAYMKEYMRKRRGKV